MTELAASSTVTLEDLRGPSPRMCTGRVPRAAYVGAASTSRVRSTSTVGSLIADAWTFAGHVGLGDLRTESWCARGGMCDAKMVVVDASCSAVAPNATHRLG